MLNIIFQLIKETKQKFHFIELLLFILLNYFFVELFIIHFVVQLLLLNYRYLK